MPEAAPRLTQEGRAKLTAMRISDLTIACLLLFVGAPQGARAQDFANGQPPLPPRPIPGIALPEPGPSRPAVSDDAVIAPAPNTPTAHSALPFVPFSNAREALRAWMRDSSAGDQVGAVRALEYAASQGHLTAQYKLGRMYAGGEGVPANDLKAFEYFSKIADENADAAPGTAAGRMVGSAFVALGSYFADGIRGSYVKPNPDRAFDMFNYAASYFGDPDGQYNLARLYMKGQGTARDPRQAARWMKLAAEKGHAPARAAFGEMLLRGGEGVPRQPVLGLMWLALARDGADPVRESWIIERHDAAFAAASAADRQAATALLERQQLAGSGSPTMQR
ncbi:sel1 repeat family protein [Bosea minatitlanensis]